MNSIKAYYEQLIQTCHYFLVGIKKNKTAFIISIILGSLPFIYMYNVKKNVYESSFTVSYEELVRKIYGDRLQKVNLLVQQNNIEKLTALLRVDENIAKSIVSVKGKNILGEDLSKDMNTDKIPFVVKVMVRDSSHLNEIQAGILSFLEYGNDYMAEKNKIRLQEISNEIDFIDNQLHIMDSVTRVTKADKHVVPAGKNIESNISASLFQFSYELYKKRQDLYSKKALGSSLQVVDDAIVSKSTKGSIIVYTIYSIVLSLVIYMLIAGFILPVIRYKEQ